MKSCLKCKYSQVNLWGYIECWKFDRELDFEDTKHTAIREKHAETHNRDGQCPHYERIPFISRLIDWMFRRRI